jgi:hypothetical protein
MLPTLLEHVGFMVSFEMSVEMPAKRQKTGEGSAYDESSQELAELVTPSGRKLRDVQGWAESGVPLSTLTDKCARLLDMAAEQILCIFGDPYGKHQMLRPAKLLALASFTVVFAYSRSAAFLALASYTVARFLA